MIPLRKISPAELDAWCRDGEALDVKNGYPAVVLHPDGTVTKLWARPLRFFSSARWRPYSDRFVRNATHLRERGIKVPELLLHGQLEGSHIRLVRYRSLPGTSIRELLRSNPQSLDIPALAAFYARLHDVGIAFRSIHFGNVILTPQHDYGLIDFSNLELSKRPLTIAQRGKNLANPLRYREDITLLKAAALPDFLDAYCQTIHATPQDSQTILTLAHKG